MEHVINQRVLKWRNKNDWEILHSMCNYFSHQGNKCKLKWLRVQFTCFKWLRFKKRCLKWIWGKTNTYWTRMGVQASVVITGVKVEAPQKARNRSTIWPSYTIPRAICKVFCILHRFVHDRLFFFSVWVKLKFMPLQLELAVCCIGMLPIALVIDFHCKVI